MRKKWAIVLCVSLIVSLCMAGCQGQAKKPYTPSKKPNTTTKSTGELSASERRVMASRLSTVAQEVDGVKKATVVVSSIGMTNNLGTGTSTNMTKRTTPNLKPGGTTTNKTGTGTNLTPGGNMNQGGTNTNPNTVQNPPAGTNVSGLVVMIGLSLEPGKTNANQANSIKRTVANRIKANDKRISQVLVTTDPGLIQRLNDVAAGIIQGRPIQGYQKDINDLTRSMRQQQPAF